MVSTDHFRQELLAQMSRAFKGGLIDVLINSRELYHSLGGYPGSMHGMPSCCDAMQAEMKPGDTLNGPMALALPSGIACPAPTEATFQTFEITVCADSQAAQ